MRELSVLAAAREDATRDCLVDRGRALSYAEVAERVRGAMRALRARGIEPGDPIAIAPRPDLASAVWLYALFEIGCPAVLLHPRLTDRERGTVLSQSQPVYRIDGAPPESSASGEQIELGDRTVPEERTLAVVYTSGTRGVPRGARLSRRAFVASASAHASNLPWEPEDRWLLCMPPAHVGGLSILTRCLIARRCVALSEGPFEAERAIRIMERDRVTLLSVVPTMLHRLLSCDEPRWAPDPALRAVLVGGAPFPDSLRRRAVERGIPALATYGCTEACSQVATQSLHQIGTPGSGAPLEGIGLRIRRDEIQIRGSVLMDGYLDEDRMGASWTDDGWFRTGDAGAFSTDGQLMVHGRLDEMIVTGGENVAPREVEASLEAVPGVRAACVFSVPDEEWGQRVVAALEIEPGAYRVDALRARLDRDLASYKHPKQICIVEALPLNRSGKIDRMEVARRFIGALRPISSLS